MLHEYPLAQQVRHYVANILWHLLAKLGHLGFAYVILYMLQCLFEKQVCEDLSTFK
jgi:hypothetical protein